MIWNDRELFLMTCSISCYLTVCQHNVNYQRTSVLLGYRFLYLLSSICRNSCIWPVSETYVWKYFTVRWNSVVAHVLNKDASVFGLSNQRLYHQPCQIIWWSECTYQAEPWQPECSGASPAIRKTGGEVAGGGSARWSVPDHIYCQRKHLHWVPDLWLTATTATVLKSR